MEALRNGDSLVIFPEGTRGHGADPASFKSGLFALAEAFPEVQLIPAWIDNVQRVMPKGEVVPVPILCTVIFGAPIALAPRRGAARVPRPGTRRRHGAARRRLMGHLRALSVTQQVGLLFVVAVRPAEPGHADRFQPLVPRRSPPTGKPAANAFARDLRALWVGALLFWIAWASGPFVSTLLFGFVSFLALREFVTLTHTRRADHRSLLLAFFVVLPAQYVLVGTRAVQRLHGVHPGLRVLRDPGHQRARQRSAALPRAHRQDPVGHHGVRVRHEPRAGAAAARPAELRTTAAPSSSSSW